MNDKTELIFGYGSLMSFRGLYRNWNGITENIRILDAYRVHIKGQRGFAKPSSRNIICMDIDNFEFKGSLIKIRPRQGYIEGLLIKINQNYFPEFSRREGYTKGNELITYSSDYNSIGEALWNLFQYSIVDNDSNQSITEYRNNLREKINYTSIDYIPHPLELKNLGYAITFIAPGKYGTGNTFQPSQKEQESISGLMNANDVLQRNGVNKNEFLEYLLQCIYGGVHGINVHDIIDLIPEDSELLKCLQKDLTEESINKEKRQFAHTIFSSLERYEQKFGNLDQNLKRSGLKLILDFGN